MTRLAALASAGVLFLANLARGDELLTPKHEAGRCAMRDHCGSKSFFGKQLPCLDNGLAKEPEQSVRQQLVDLCGPKWKEGPVCCTEDQVRLLIDALPTMANWSRAQLADKHNFLAGYLPKRRAFDREHDCFIMSCMQRELLQLILHLHVLARPIAIHQRYKNNGEEREDTRH